MINSFDDVLIYWKNVYSKFPHPMNMILTPGYISLLEAVVLWLIELPIHLFFLGLPGGYYQQLKKQQNNV